MDPKNFFSVEQFADQLGVSARTIERRLRTGQAPRPAFHRGLRLWTPEQIREAKRLAASRRPY
jgi:hypothetical protein